MYNVLDYGTMISDPVRVDAYRAALRSVVEPGCSVLDVGTGTGLFALLAARMGAGRIYAVDPSDALQVAREIARSNGLADRITFLQGDSLDVELPEPVDVVVSDLRGVLPIHARSLRCLMDARDRLARPGAALVPARDVLRAALIEDPEAYDRLVGPWEGGALDLDLSAARRYATNMWRRSDPPPERLLSSPQTWATLDYASIRSDRVSGRLEWGLEREGTLHGILVWFDAELTDTIGYSNAPGSPGRVYGRAFFPLSGPVGFMPGTRVQVDLTAYPVGAEYIWQWETHVTGPAGDAPVAYRQSTFQGLPISPERLALRDPAARPLRSGDAAVQHTALGLMDGEHTVARIAEALQIHFPDLFEDLGAAMEQAAALAARFGRISS